MNLWYKKHVYLPGVISCILFSPSEGRNQRPRAPKKERGKALARPRRSRLRVRGEKPRERGPDIGPDFSFFGSLQVAGDF